MIFRMHLRANSASRRPPERHLMREIFAWVLGQVETKFNQSLVYPIEMCGRLRRTLSERAPQVTVDTFHSVLVESPFAIPGEDIESKLHLKLAWLLCLGLGRAKMIDRKLTDEILLGRLNCGELEVRPIRHLERRQVIVGCRVHLPSTAATMHRTSSPSGVGISPGDGYSPSSPNEHMPTSPRFVPVAVVRPQSQAHVAQHTRRDRLRPT